MPARYLLLVLIVSAGPALAQGTLPDTLAAPPPGSLDVRLLHALYAQDGPAAAAFFHAVDRSSTRLFAAAIPAAWVGTWALSDAPRDYRPAYRLALSEIAATALVVGSKAVVRRPRPFMAEADIVSRSATHHPAGRVSYAFPSGHAAISFALATSVSLSAPEWYVVVPAVGWATAVSLSRPWLGVHYPSDIVVGAALGAGVAVFVHALGDTIVPAVFVPDDAAGTPPALVVPLLRATF